MFRRDAPEQTAEVRALVRALETGELVVTTGLVLQELLQGFNGPKARTQILDRFLALPMLAPERQDHVAAADLRNLCRRNGVQTKTVDALLAQLCLRHGLTMLTADADFRHMAKHCALRIWQN
jgi:predicted nucleic acid-binding protein